MITSTQNSPQYFFLFLFSDLDHPPKAEGGGGGKRTFTPKRWRYFFQSDEPNLLVFCHSRLTVCSTFRRWLLLNSRDCQDPSVSVENRRQDDFDIFFVGHFTPPGFCYLPMERSFVAEPMLLGAGSISPQYLQTSGWTYVITFAQVGGSLPLPVWWVPCVLVGFPMPFADLGPGPRKNRCFFFSQSPETPRKKRL